MFPYYLEYIVSTLSAFAYYRTTLKLYAESGLSRVVGVRSMQGHMNALPMIHGGKHAQKRRFVICTVKGC